MEIFYDNGWFFATRIRFMKRILTDPDPQHWKLIITAILHETNISTLHIQLWYSFLSRQQFL